MIATVAIVGALVGASIAGLLFKVFLPSYLSEKGKNLATKEDIREITVKIEGVKAALGSRLHIHQVRYEHEFKILSELTEKLVAVRDTAMGLRPEMSYDDGRDPDVKNKRMGRTNISDRSASCARSDYREGRASPSKYSCHTPHVHQPATPAGRIARLRLEAGRPQLDRHHDPRLRTLHSGRWQGPDESAVGLHRSGIESTDYSEEVSLAPSSFLIVAKTTRYSRHPPPRNRRSISGLVPRTTLLIVSASLARGLACSLAKSAVTR